MTMWLAGMMGSGKTSSGAVAAERSDRYQEAADDVIETSGKSIVEMADEIAALWAT